MKKKSINLFFNKGLIFLAFTLMFLNNIYAYNPLTDAYHNSSVLDFTQGITLPSNVPAGTVGQILSSGIIKFADGTSAQEIYVKKLRVSNSWATNDAHDPGDGGIFASGNILALGSITGDAFLYESDFNLKKDICSLSNSLKKVKQLRGVSFVWKDTNRKDIGLIAQDVEKVLPELVHTNSEGLKSVEYGNLVALLIEAVKEQDKKIEFQQQQINELKSRLEEIE